MKTKLGDLPEIKEVGQDIACKVYVVGHYGADRAFCTVAESRKVAAIAYVAMVGAQNQPVPIGAVWVRDETGIQSTPLAMASSESIQNWVARDASRAQRIQAAIKQLKAVVN